MMSWLAPFVTLGVVVILYLLAGRNGGQEAMRRDINFYLVCILGTAIVAIIAGLSYDKDWMDVAAWVIAGVASAAAVWHQRRPARDSDAV